MKKRKISIALFITAICVVFIFNLPCVWGMKDDPEITDNESASLTQHKRVPSNSTEGEHSSPGSTQLGSGRKSVSFPRSISFKDLKKKRVVERDGGALEKSDSSSFTGADLKISLADSSSWSVTTSSPSPSPLPKEDISLQSASSYPCLQETEEEKEFMDFALSLLKEDKLSLKTFVLTYPFYVREKILLKHLIEFKREPEPIKEILKEKGKKQKEQKRKEKKSQERSPQEIISSFLEQLVLMGFPNGIDELQANLEEYNQLKKGIKSPPILDNILLKLEENIVGLSQLEIFLNPCFPNDNEKRIRAEVSNPINEKWKKENDISLEDWDMGKFEKALIARDTCLVRSLSFKDMKMYLKDQNNLPESIQKFLHYAELTTRDIAWRLVTVEEEEARNRQIRKVCCISALLIHKKYFQGAWQVGMSLNKTSVDRLIPEEIRKDPNYQILSRFLSLESNHSVYRKLFAESQEMSNCFPQFSVLAADIILGDQRFQLQKNANHLEAIAVNLEFFLKYRTLASHPSVDSHYLELITRFKNIREEALEVISDIRKEWTAVRRHKSSHEKLNEWTPLDFASLLREKNCEHLTEILFIQGIQEGQDILDYMGQGALDEKKERLEELGISTSMIDAILSAYKHMDAEK